VAISDVFLVKSLLTGVAKGADIERFTYTDG
jgi:hypothetical protein